MRARSLLYSSHAWRNHSLAGGAVLRLTLDNPPANVLSLAIARGVAGELNSARADEDVRVVIIAAAGKLFSGGHDLAELTAHRADADPAPISSARSRCARA